MAAAAALNVVKQIEALADAPHTPQMRDCLVQLVSSLQFFLDHPDSRVRMGSARTLLKLSRGYKEEFAKIDLTKVSSALAKCRNEENGDELSADYEKLLAEIVEPESQKTKSLEHDSEALDPAPENAPSRSSKDGHGRGEIVLKLLDESDGSTNASILQKIIRVPGVVAVTLEGPNVIVTSKNIEVANDAAFREELQTVLKTAQQGDKENGSSGAAGSSDDKRAHDDVVPVLFNDAEDVTPSYLDQDDDFEEDNSQSASGGYSAPPLPPSGGMNGAGVPQWSFFSQTNWMTGRRVQEFDDDPTIAARLAKVKKRQEEKRKAEESSIGFVSRWLRGTK